VKDKLGDLLLTDDMTPDQRSEYQRLLASPTSTARALIEARAEFQRTNDRAWERYAALSKQLEEANTRQRAAESQIAALKVDLAAMMKERDEANEQREWERQKRIEAEDTRDAAHAELSQARAELSDLRVKYDAACKGSRERLDVIMRTQAEAAAMRRALEMIMDNRACASHACEEIAHTGLDVDAGRALAERVPLWRELESLCSGTVVRDDVQAIVRKLAALDEKGGA
jgi:chromosome segregation ATPase